MRQRSIGMMILLSIVTFGIYQIYWVCSFQSELKARTGEGFSGTGHFFMAIVTFGIYSIYWQYAAGKRLSQQGSADDSILYLILSLIGIGFLLNPFLMQSNANKLNSPQRITA